MTVRKKRRVRRSQDLRVAGLVSQKQRLDTPLSCLGKRTEKYLRVVQSEASITRQEDVEYAIDDLAARADNANLRCRDEVAVQDRFIRNATDLVSEGGGDFNR